MYSCLLITHNWVWRDSQLYINNITLGVSFCSSSFHWILYYANSPALMCVAKIHSLFTAMQYSILTIRQFIFSSIEGHVGCEYLFAITNCPTRNILELASLYIFGGLSLGSGSQSGGPQTSSNSITWWLIRNANYLPLPDPLNQRMHEWEWVKEWASGQAKI